MHRDLRRPTQVGATEPLESRLLLTDVSGRINVDTVWDNTSEPYKVTGNVVVSSGVTLTVRPGVTIHTGFSLDDIDVAGTMRGNGVILTGNTEIRAVSGGRVELDGAELDGQWLAFDANSSGFVKNSSFGTTKLSLRSPSVEIDDSSFTRTDPIEIDPDLMEEIYDNTFLAAASVTFKGNINTSVTWRAIDNLSRYVLPLLADMAVVRGTVWTVEPGVTIHTGNSLDDIDIFGHANINGAVFSGNTDISAWNGARLDLHNVNAAGSLVTYADGSSGTASCSAINSTLIVHDGSSADFRDLDFTGGFLDARGSSSVVMDFQNNWWGTTNSSLIEQKIKHNADNGGLPVVDFSPWLTGYRPVPCLDFTVIETDEATIVGEAGPTDTVSVVLNYEPAEAVDIVLTVNDASEASVDTSRLMFTPSNWDTPQTVTISGVDDLIADGDQITTIDLQIDDAARDPLSDRSFSVTTIDNDPGFTIVETDDTTSVSETGTSDDFSVVLDVPPFSDVVILVANDLPVEVGASRTSLTFTPANWSTPQIVNVTGLDDSVADGDRVATLTLSIDAAKSHSAFVSLPDQTVLVTNEDDDAGFSISETGGVSEVDETGTTDTFTVVLDAPPSGNVVLNLTANDSTEVSINKSVLTFTSANWNTPQAVTMTGVDDFLIDGNLTTTITVSVDDANSDDAFDLVDDKVVSVKTNSEDMAGFVLDKSSMIVSEAGSSESFTAWLTAQPDSDVVLTVDRGDSDEFTLSESQLTFTPANWNTPQLVTVTGVDDSIIDGDIDSFVTVSVNSPQSHAAFGSVGDQLIAVKTTNDDAAGFTLSQDQISVLESGTSDSLTVVLDAEPAVDVVLVIDNGDVSEVSVDKQSFTFTSGNWNVPQTLTIAGVDDSIIDGNGTTSVTVAIDAANSDDDFDSVDGMVVTATTTDDDVAGFSLTKTEVVVSETGTSDSITVVLTAQPATDVVLGVTNPDSTEIDVDKTQLTFTPTNWNVAQTIVFAGVDDILADGTKMTNVVVAVDANASDTDFNDVESQAITATTTDNEEPGFTVSQTAVEVAESADSKTFTVVLNAEPAVDVVLIVDNADPTNVELDTESLTFTTANWGTPQIITLSGVDDSRIDADAMTLLTVSVDAANSDDAFDAVNDKVVTVTTTNDDFAGLVIDRTAGTVLESSTSFAFTVVLSAEPAGNVTVNALNGDLSEATVDRPTLIFTPANWNAPQSIVVTGVDDFLVDDNVVSVVTVSVNDSQSDDAFDSVEDQAVAVTTVDDDIAGFTISKSTVVVSESGASDSVAVTLDAQPSSDVVIVVNTSDSSEVSAATSQLTFTTANWGIPQVLILTGVDDSIIDDDAMSSVTLRVDGDVSDDAFDGVDEHVVLVTTEDDDTAGFLISNTTVTVSESGANESFTVVLTAQPMDDVVIDVGDVDATEFSVNRTRLVFTADDWSTPQVVSLTGVDDTIADGVQTAQATLSVDSGVSDVDFAILNSQSVEVMILDDEVAGFEVSQTTISLTEAGTSISVTIGLTAQPVTDVELAITNSDPSEVSVGSDRLTFSTANWDTHQTVTLTGIDDFVSDGDITTSIVISIDTATSDVVFHAVGEQVISATTADDDEPGYVVSKTSVVVSETGTSETFTIVLLAEPTSNVVFDIANADPTEVVLDSASLTFTPTNWSTPQTVSVTGVDDADVDGDVMTSVTISVDSAESDADFGSLAEQVVTATTLNDDDEPSFTIDADGDGQQAALTDGILIMRYLAGFTSESLVTGAVNEQGARSTADDVIAWLSPHRTTFLDVDGNGTSASLTDGLLILRYLSGFRNDALINNVVDPAGTRITPGEITAFLDQLTGQNGQAAPVARSAFPAFASGTHNDSELDESTITPHFVFESPTLLPIGDDAADKDVHWRSTQELSIERFSEQSKLDTLFATDSLNSILDGHLLAKQ